MRRELEDPAVVQGGRVATHACPEERHGLVRRETFHRQHLLPGHPERLPRGRDEAPTGGDRRHRIEEREQSSAHTVDIVEEDPRPNRGRYALGGGPEKGPYPACRFRRIVAQAERLGEGCQEARLVVHAGERHHGGPGRLGHLGVHPAQESGFSDTPGPHQGDERRATADLFPQRGLHVGAEREARASGAIVAEHVRVLILARFWVCGGKFTDLAR